MFQSFWQNCVHTVNNIVHSMDHLFTLSTKKLLVKEAIKSNYVLDEIRFLPVLLLERRRAIFFSSHKSLPSVVNLNIGQ